MTTVAEGVETSEQFETLAHLGCDQSQGYLHSRPLSVTDIEPMIRAGNSVKQLLAPNHELAAHGLTAMARRG
jgi:EAL domain-containing protein (putative c-di-GMP-specific phosphodiesterase class I)